MWRTNSFIFMSRVQFFLKCQFWSKISLVKILTNMIINLFTIQTTKQNNYLLSTEFKLSILIKKHIIGLNSNQVFSFIFCITNLNYQKWKVPTYFVIETITKGRRECRTSAITCCMYHLCISKDCKFDIFAIFKKRQDLFASSRYLSAQKIIMALI